MKDYLYVITDNETGEILCKTDDWFDVDNFFQLEVGFRTMIGERCDFNFKTYERRDSNDL